MQAWCVSQRYNVVTHPIFCGWRRWAWWGWCHTPSSGNTSLSRNRDRVSSRRPGRTCNLAPTFSYRPGNWWRRLARTSSSHTHRKYPQGLPATVHHISSYTLNKIYPVLCECYQQSSKILSYHKKLSIETTREYRYLSILLYFTFCSRFAYSLRLDFCRPQLDTNL